MRKQRDAFSPLYTAPPQSDLRCCDHPDCVLPGEYRAPKAPDNLSDYYWFCLEHVRAYNQAWDYYAGMTPEEIEDQIRRDTTWQRPTWPMGQWNVERLIHDKIRADFDIGGSGPEAAGPPPQHLTEEMRALRLFELVPPVSFKQIKARYHQLVKRHHPDANGGDKASEERLKGINQAYSTLKAAYGG